MDIYGQILLHKSDELSLGNLAHELLYTDQKKPQGWLVAAMHSELRGDIDKAILFVDKVGTVGS